VIFDDEIIQDFIDSSAHTFEQHGYGLWLIEEKTGGAVIGFTGLRSFFEEPQPQLLYALFENFTGKGYAKEAARKIIDYSFDALRFSYLVASCDAPNLPSQQLALSLDMKLFKEEEKEGLLTLFYKIEQDE
jgi:ribosomal-protein-alanine N-acetyltransferase